MTWVMLLQAAQSQPSDDAPWLLIIGACVFILAVLGLTGLPGMEEG